MSNWLLNDANVTYDVVSYIQSHRGSSSSLNSSPDGNYIVIAIENERDEDLGSGEPPQLPAGFVVVVDSSDVNPDQWVSTPVEVTGLPGVRFPTDPEPEVRKIRSTFPSTPATFS